MGLDITALNKVTFIEGLNDVEEYEEKYDWRTHRFVHDYGDDWAFSEWAKDLRPGVYKAKKEHRFRAGSYSGYNSWREWLCRIVLHVAPKTVWDNKDAYRDKPFFRLINFSDCEGYIGPKFSKVLAADFAAHQEVIDVLDCEEWYKQQYANWRKAFELAADDGYVDFH